MATFRPGEHLRRRADFEAAYQTGAKVSGRLMTLFARKSGGTLARLGIAATRKIGGAVVRNRAKRLTRELFRSHKPPAGLDVIVIPRREFLDAPYPSLEREYTALLERVARAAERGPRPADPRPGPGRTRRTGPDSRV